MYIQHRAIKLLLPLATEKCPRELPNHGKFNKPKYKKEKKDKEKTKKKMSNKEVPIHNKFTDIQNSSF